MSRSIDSFPFETVPSLDKLSEFWRRAADDPGDPSSAVAREVVEMLGEAPELDGPITDPSVLEKHAGLVELMMSAVIPTGLRDEVLTAALEPFRMRTLYESPVAKRLEIFDEERFQRGSHMAAEDMVLGKTMFVYNAVLHRFYGEETFFDFPFVVTVEDPESAQTRHFSIQWDPRFVDIKAKGEVKPLSADDLAALAAEPMNLPLWIETLPPDGFSFHGLTVVTAVDVTGQEVLSLLRADLVKKGAMGSVEQVERLQDRIRTLLRRPELEIGLIAVTRGGDDVNVITGARALGKSLLLSDDDAPACSYKDQSYYAAAIEKRDPIIVHDLQACDVCTGFEHHLRSQSLRNLLLCPLYLGDDLVGLLELGSPNPGDMNAFNSLKLMKIADLFAAAMSRSIEEREDRVQAIIKQQYTAIHPSVEWRFRDAASNYVAALERGDQPQVEEIVFSEVYPLYGLSDVRGSSTKRNSAIQADLGEQLGYALEVVEEARIYRPLPILDELRYRVQRYVEQVRTGLRTDDEHSVIEFLKRRVEPVFDRIAKYGDGVQQKIEQYRAALDPSLGLVYRKRKAFEEALSAIRETVAAKIDEEQERAQAMFPHYFEKFKTDGVDYTIYVGGSLVGGDEFDPLYLANLRLWQLMMMCRIDVSLRAAKSIADSGPLFVVASRTSVFPLASMSRNRSISAGELNPIERPKLFHRTRCCGPPSKP